MTKIYTIGANGKSAKEFFEIIKKNNIELLIDIRLNNKSQLAGFTKGGDDFLGFLLEEICNAKYIHDPYLAPTEEILNKYHDYKNWNEYVTSFSELIKKRNIKKYFFDRYSSFNNVCLLCSEITPEKCHRRLVAEELFNKEDITHL